MLPTVIVCPSLTCRFGQLVTCWLALSSTRLQLWRHAERGAVCCDRLPAFDLLFRQPLAFNSLSCPQAAALAVC